MLYLSLRARTETGYGASTFPNRHLRSITHNARVQRFQCDSRPTIVVFEDCTNNVGVTWECLLSEGNHNAAPCMVIHLAPQRSEGDIYIHPVIFNETNLISFDQKIWTKSSAMDY